MERGWPAAARLGAGEFSDKNSTARWWWRWGGVEVEFPGRTMARLEGARFMGACAAVTNPRGSPSSPVLLVAQAAAEALHAPEFTKFIIILIQLIGVNTKL